MKRLTIDHGFCGFAVASAVLASSASAAPPLVTDDAGVVSKGAAEFTIAYEGETRDSGDSAAAPSVEVEYGVRDGLQVAVGVGRAVVDAPGESSRSDFDAISLESKWQFYADDNIAIAVVPAYSFPLSSSSTDRGIIEDVRVLSLPAVVSWESGNWNADAQVAYDMTSTGPNAWFAGLAGGYQATESVKLLAEVYQTRVVGEDADETNWNVGVDLAVGESLALLAAFGGNLDSDLDATDELDTTFFLGFRYETE